jgi:hypothetical protein
MFAASTSLAQTKEETIAWLQEKINVYAQRSYGDYQIELVYITECRLEVEYSSEENPDQIDFIEYIPLNGLGINNKGYLKSDNKGITRIHLSYTNQDGEAVASIADTSFVSKASIIITESEIYDLFIKSINHLSTFCAEK